MVRAVAILAVVVIHSSAIAQARMSIGSPLYPLYVALTYASLFAVPVFVFVSGLVLAHVGRRGIPSYGAFFRSRVAAVGAPYVIWTLFYHAYSARTSHLPLGGAWVAGLARALLLGTGFYHLYFIVIILQLYLLFPAVLGLAKSLEHHRVSVIAAFGLVHLVYLWLLHRLPFPYSDRFFLTYLVFFAAGVGFGLRLEEHRGWTSRSRFGLGGLCVLTGLIYVGSSVAAVAYHLKVPGLALTLLWSGYSLAVGVFLFALTARRKGLFLAGLGRDSFGIYLAHPIILVAAEGVFAAVGLSSTTLRFLGEVIVALGGSALLTRLGRQFRYGYLVFGR